MTVDLDYSKNFSHRVSTLVDLLRYKVQHQPGKLAFTFLQDGETEAGSLTYKELDQKAQAIAGYLESLGAAGERALLLYPSGLEFIAAFFGCLYAGVVAVPAYPPRRNQKMSRLQAIVADAQATVTLTTKELLTNTKSCFAENPELAALHWLTTDDIASEQVAAWQEPIVSSETLAFLQYTSGSTGMPKGVMVSHGNLLHNSEYIKQAFELTPDSVSVTWLPSFHDMGLIDGIIQPLYTGFLGVLMPSASFVQRPIRWLQAISRYRATHCGGPNFGYELCVRNITLEQRKSLDLSSWCSAYSGAEPVHRETLERFASAFKPCGFRASSFYPCYGMAEATLMVSGGGVRDEPVYCTVQADALEHNWVVETSENTKSIRHLVGCGRSLLEAKIVIADPKLLTQCAPHQVGEIWVSGASVAQGYWNQPKETEKIFHAYLTDTGEGPFLRTGDLGFLNDGELFVTGRLKDLIIVRGRNHYPQDIELTVERSHPALRPGCGAAFAVEVEGQERLVVVQEVERSYLRQLDVNEVLGAVRKAVSEQHELQVYAVVLLKTASIPKTSSGKIQRHACQVGFLEGSLDVVGNWTADLHQIDLLQLQTEVEAQWEHLQASTQQEPSSEENKSKVGKRSLKSTPTQEAIEIWLVSHLALYLKVPLDEIDIREPFTAYGLDSSVAVSITGELATWLDCKLEPTLFWEYPSIKALAQHLVAECQLSRSTSSVGFSAGM